MIRKPAVAGSFYPSTESLLIKKIEHCFEGEFGPKERRGERLIGGVVPHAGYEFSGQCAAWFYSRLSERKVFVILGPNHTGIGHGFSVMTEGKWETPLGYAEIESNIAKELSEGLDFVKEDHSPHLFEHSIEVQIPFLQYLFGDVFFVPVCISNKYFHPKYTKRFGEFLKQFKGDILVIASSDFTHYGFWYGYYPYGIGRNAHEIGKKKDLEIINLVLSRKVEELYERSKRMTICGIGPIISLMSFSDRDGRLLKYYTSAEITRDFDNWVGYASIVF